jgi:hypothetical protein
MRFKVYRLTSDKYMVVVYDKDDNIIFRKVYYD